jgi:CheY-like chemotaxis protein
MILNYMTGTIIAVNGAALRFLRREESEFVGRDLSVLFPGQGPAALAELMEEIRMFGHANAECMVALGSQQMAETQVHATAYAFEGSQEILLTMRASSQGAQSTQDAENKIRKLRTLIEEMKRLNYELNNPLQELISVLELQWGQSYQKPIERITRSMSELRSLCSPAATTRPTISKPRTVLTNDNRVACTKNRILIVDDESSIRNLFTHILQVGLPEATLDTATGGAEALREFKQSHHELVIVDYHMPEMTGERVLRGIEEFCRVSGWKMPAVILCTGYDPGDALSRLKANNQSHSCLMKPVSRNQLLHVVQEKLTEASASSA